MRYIVIDKQGNTITKDYYKRIDTYSNGFAWAIKTNDTRVFLDKNGNEVYSTKNYCFRFSEGLAPIEVNNKIGFVNTNFDTVIKPEFQQVHFFNNGFCGVQKNNLWGVIDKLGTEIVPPTYHAIFIYNEGSSPFKKHKGWGLVDEQGNETFYCSKAETIDTMEEGLSIILQNKKVGYCCNRGIIIDPKYDNAKSFSNGLAAVYENKQWHFINKDGTKAFNKSFKHVFHRGFNEGICAVSNDDNSMFFIDTLGNKIFDNKYISPKRYDPIIPPIFINGLAIAANMDMTSMILKEERLANYLRHEKRLYNYGLNNHSLGMINSRGETVIEFKYDYIQPFRENVAVVKSNKRCYFINEAGSPIFHQSFLEAYAFEEERAIVKI